ncbi:S9 family peptidase, partial [Planctomycetota bacterium]
RGRLMAVAPGDTEAKPYLENVEISVSNPTWSPDGNYFVCTSRNSRNRRSETETSRPNMYSTERPRMGLYLVSVKDGQARNISESIEDNVSQPVWSADGKAVFFKTLDSENYDEALYGYFLEDAELRVLCQGQESYSISGAAADGLVVTIQDATRPQDMWLIDAKSGEKQQLTTLNPQLGKFRFSKPELFDYYNADGERLAGLIYKPVDYQPKQKVPVITYVYEKLSNGRHRFNARNQIFLNHGYAMLLPDVKIKVGETGTSFVKCVVPAVNAARALGFTNDKFGIWGGSFGAYATSFIITQTDIFACAVSRATPPELFRNWASGRDRDSRNIVSGQARMGADPFEARQRYIDQSAFFHLDKVNTPVLIMHGVKDYTILFGEGEMMFYALRQLGKEAEFVIYNYGDHSLSRGSRSDTLDVNRRMLDWFEKYLKEK